MKYDTSDTLQKAKFLARASFIAERGKTADLTELRPSARRTAAQNRCWHSWCALIAEIVDAPQEDVERDVKRKILGQRKAYDVFTGEETTEDYQTRLMSDDEMSAFLTKVKQWALSTYGWALPSRDDVFFDEMIKEKRSYEQK